MSTNANMFDINFPAAPARSAGSSVLRFGRMAFSLTLAANLRPSREGDAC